MGGREAVFSAGGIKNGKVPATRQHLVQKLVAQCPVDLAELVEFGDLAQRLDLDCPLAQVCHPGGVHPTRDGDWPDSVGLGSGIRRGPFPLAHLLQQQSLELIGVSLWVNFPWHVCLLSVFRKCQSITGRDKIMQHQHPTAGKENERHH